MRRKRADPVEADADGSVSGVVRRQSGQPVPEARLQRVAMPPASFRLPEVAYETMTDGSYWIGVPPATYLIQAYAEAEDDSPLYGEATEVVVTAGQDTRADIVLTERRD
jgi:Carboxypeptidase regulatory-like domain